MKTSGKGICIFVLVFLSLAVKAAGNDGFDLLKEAISMQRLGDAGMAAGNIEEAERAYSRALHLYRLLTEKHPVAFLPNMAEVLDGLGLICYKDGKDPGKCLRYADEAIGIYRELIKTDRAGYGDRFSNSLILMGVFFSAGGDRARSCSVMTEAFAAAYSEELKDRVGKLKDIYCKE